MELDIFSSFRDSSVGIIVGYWKDGCGSIPGRDIIFVFSISSSSPLGPTKSTVY
jgi:hypothetical protein